MVRERLKVENITERVQERKTEVIWTRSGRD